MTPLALPAPSRSRHRARRANRTLDLLRAHQHYTITWSPAAPSGARPWLVCLQWTANGFTPYTSSGIHIARTEAQALTLHREMAANQCPALKAMKSITIACDRLGDKGNA